jgi:glycosyltransferase involved in cell wall biosynthesis
MVQKIDRSRYEVYAAVGMPSRLQERLEDAGAVVTAFADGFRDPTVRNFVQVRDLLSSIQPDIIHSNAINGFPLLWNSIDKRIPFIQHVRNGNMRGYREYVESASAVIAVSKYLGDNVLRFAIRPDRVHVVYNEVDTEYFDSSRFDRSIARKRHRIPEEAKVIAMIARFARNKRHDLILRAFESVLLSVPSAYLLLKGEDYHDDPYYDKVQAQIQSCSGKEHIRHVKFVDDIREIHAAADLLVLCSDREGLGRCVVEAMSMGLPVVVTDTGGTHEIVEDGVTGIIVPGSDAAALARAVISVLKDDDFRRSASLLARQVAISKLSSLASSAAVMDIYDGCK